MKFLNLVNTDATLYNLLCFGVEGTHYTVNADGTVTSDDSKGYNPNIDWMLGNQFNALLREGQAPDIWEKTKALNGSAVESKALGFSFDSTPVTNEIASVSAAYDQYGKILETGGADPAQVLPEFREKLKASGADKIIAEMQKQVDEWKSSK
jgi:putative aldouronate transport system substrate-binding protein